MGSGSSICACIEEGYNYIAFELDENIFGLSMKRINNFKKLHEQTLFKKSGGKLIK